MDISFNTALPPVVTSSRSGNGAAGFAQAAPAILDQTLPKTNTSSSIPLQTDTSGAQETREAISANQLDQAIRQVNNAFNQKGQNLYASFEKDKITGINVVKIVEKKTNEIIRQMPPKEIVALAQSLAVPHGWRGQLILDKA